MSILKDKRELRALSQQDLAGESGVAKSTIVRIENGQHRPNWVTIRKLAKALECEVSELVHLRQEREQRIGDETTNTEQLYPRESKRDHQREYFRRMRAAGKKGNA